MELGWIDFSNKDKKKALDVLHLLQEQGAVDELGIGIIRDAFANYFFPGTSTVQTRAKYFLIVPYVIRDICNNTTQTTIAKVLQEIDNKEKECALQLMKSNKDGVIGATILPDKWVIRKPHNIYWNGIKTLGIFKNKMLSVEEYIKESLIIKKLKSSRSLGNRNDATEDNEIDDKDAGDIGHYQFWKLPETSLTNWFENLTIELLPEEAAFLRQQISVELKGTLLKYLIDNNIPIYEYDSFFSLTENIYDDVSKEMQTMIDLANSFNKLVYLARIRFNMILSNGNNTNANDEWKFYVNQVKDMAKVDLESIFEKLSIRDYKVKRFLTDLRKHCLQYNFDEADKLIEKREIELKGEKRAKLRRTNEFSDEAWIGGRWLDFRYNPTKRIILDIYKAEGRYHV